MCLCFTEAPLESSHQLFEGVTVICNLHPELSDPKSGFSLCHVFMGCLLGRIQHAGGQRGDPQDTALILLTPRIKEGGPPYSVP